MSELDALLIRSLPELNDASVALTALDERFVREVNAEIDAFVARSTGWLGEGGERPWLAPADWIIPSEDPEKKNAYLYFVPDYTAGPASVWTIGSFVGAGGQRYGLWLMTDVARGRSALNRNWRDFPDKAGLQLEGSDFFLPFQLDREQLAAAVGEGDIGAALEPLRDALHRLPEIAAQLEPLKNAMVATAQKG